MSPNPTALHVPNDSPEPVWPAPLTSLSDGEAILYPLSWINEALKRIEELQNMIAAKDKVLVIFNSILKNEPTSDNMIIHQDILHPTVKLLQNLRKSKRDLETKVRRLEDQVDELKIVHERIRITIKDLSTAKADSELLSHDKKVPKPTSEDLESIIASEIKILATLDSVLNQTTSATMDDEAHPTLNFLRTSRKVERDHEVKVKGLEAHVEDLSSALENSRITIKALCVANGEYKIETSKLKKEISTLHYNIQRLEKSLDDSQSTKFRLEDKIAELQKQTSDQSAELNEIDDLLAKVREELKTANKTRAEFELQLRDCRTENLTLRRKVALADNIREDLANQKRYNAELKKRIVEFGDQIDQATEERREIFAAYDGEVQSIRSFDIGYRDSMWNFEGDVRLNNSVSNTSVSNTSISNASFPAQQSELATKCGLAGTVSAFSKTRANIRQGRFNQSIVEQDIRGPTLDTDLEGDRFGSFVASPANIQRTSVSTHERGASTTSWPSQRRGRESMQGSPLKQSQPSAPFQVEGDGNRRMTNHQDPFHSLDSGSYASGRPSAAGIRGSTRTISSTIPEDGSGVTSGPSSKQGRGALREGASTEGQSMSTLVQTESLHCTGAAERHSIGAQTERTEGHDAGTQTECLEVKRQRQSQIARRNGSHIVENPTQGSCSSLSSESSRIAGLGDINATNPTESHSSKTQTKNPQSSDHSRSWADTIQSWLSAKTAFRSHSAGSQSDIYYLPASTESRESPGSTSSTGKPRSTVLSTRTVSTPHTYQNSEVQTLPIQPEIHSKKQGVERPFLIERQHSYYAEENFEEIMYVSSVVEEQQAVHLAKPFTSSRLYRYGSPCLLLLALTVLVLRMLDLANEKEKWLASNETTRQMAWAMRAGGSYGFPFLSWLLDDAYLEIDAYSYG